MSALQKFYRTPKLFITLPSGKEYYNKDVIELTEDGEVGVLPMTVHDEMSLKNPDALLNGEAIANVLRNCAPAIKLPKLLLSMDIEALITAIRVASFGETVDVTFNCPECKKDTVVALNLRNAFNTMTFLPETNVVNLESGLSIFLRPADYTGDILSFKRQMESKKLIALIGAEEEQSPDRAQLMDNLYRSVSAHSVELLVRSIEKIVSVADGIDVSDKKEITEFLNNTTNSDIKLISEKLKEINAVGLKKTYNVQCKECSHIWEEQYEYSISSFFINS